MATAMLSSAMARPATVMRPAVLGKAVPVLPFRPASRSVMRTVPQAQQGSRDLQELAVKSVALSTLATSCLSAGNATAASEIANIAAGDNRLGVLLFVFAPVVGWVLFNIGGPALNQFGSMANKSRPVKAKPKGVRRGVAAGIGLTAASLLAAQSADAAEIAQIAAGDNRLGVLLFVFAPVLGWVLFNIGGPALAQFESVAQKNRSVKAKPAGVRRGIAAGLGLSAASLLAAQSADAAEIAQIAASDNRLGVLLFVFAPVVGWVLFNIGGPALNQFGSMANKSRPVKAKPKGVRRGVAAGVGLTAASMLAAQSADAADLASEVVQQAASTDGRFGIIASLFVPVLGWVLFNILEAAKTQYDGMAKQ